MVNVVVWRELAERQQVILLESRLLIVDGHIERKDGVQHVIVKRLHNGSPLMQKPGGPAVGTSIEQIDNDSTCQRARKLLSSVQHACPQGAGNLVECVLQHL